MTLQRRSFLAAAPAAMMAQGSGQNVKFGIDLFSLRSQGWSPFEHLDYCAKQGAKVVHFSEIRFLGGLEKAHLEKVRDHARRVGIELEIGMLSICPTAARFDPKQGTAEEQLAKMIDSARIAGAPLVRAVLGDWRDRASAVPLEQHIENTVKTLRAVRTRALDAGKKIAIENHGGDLQGRELKMLIEAAGKDFVGACIDSGNPTWAIEDPHVTLETLAPYVLTSHVRDSAVWRTPEGAAMQWTRMGEGNVDIGGWVKKFAALCPGKAMSLEIIVTGTRPFPYLQPDFWKAFRQTPAWEFARFAAIAETGKARGNRPAPAKEQAAALEREDLETSIQWVRGNQLI
jgi:sugar phosphate isomerase/epimerase